MTHRVRQFALAAACLIGQAALFAGEEGFDAARFEKHVRELCKAPHRRAGTAECAAAGRYIQTELEAMGYAVSKQTFNVPQVETSCSLSVNKRDVEIFPMRANSLQAPVTAENGIKAKTIYAGLGRIEDFNGVDPRGAIVVLDFSQLDGAAHAFAFGAAAVVYVEDERMVPYYARDKQMLAIADLPRFFMRRDVAREAGLLERTGPEVTITASAKWQNLEGVNYITMIRGSTPPNADEEAVVISCHYDSLGTVGNVAPAARAAANCAALLETARAFKSLTPTRTVVFAFFDARCQYHLGAREFYSAVHKLRIHSGNPDPLQTVRKTWFKEEREQLNKITSALNGTLPPLRDEKGDIAETRDLRRLETLIVDELDRTTSWEADRYVQPIARYGKLTVETSDASAKAHYAAKLAVLKSEKGEWSRLRRALSYRKITAAELPRLEEARTLTLARHARRLDELTLLERRNDESIAVANLLNREVDGSPKPIRIAGHFSFQLGDSSRRWGVVTGGDSPLDNMGGYGLGQYIKVFGALRTTAAKARRKEPAALENFFDGTISGLYEPRMWVPAPFTHCGEMAEGYGIFGFTFMTMGDGYLREGLPADVPANLNFENIRRQAREAARLLAAVADEPEFSVRSTLPVRALDFVYQRTNGTLIGNNVIRMKEGSSVADEPAAGVIIAALPARNSSFGLGAMSHIPGYERIAYTVADSNGFFPLRSVIGDAWAFDAARFDDRGRVSEITSHHVDNRRQCFLNFGRSPIRLQLFPCQGATLTLCRDLLNGVPMREADWKLLDAMTDGDFPRYYIRQLDETLSIYVPFEKNAKLFGKSLYAILFNSPELAGGTGIEWPTADMSGVTRIGISPSQQASHDMWNLNESRLKLLRKANLYNNSVEKLHSMAEGLSESAAADLTKQNCGTAYAKSEAAAIACGQIYQPTMMMMNDVIKAVIFLLVLTIPFAFSLERLFIGTANIYKQIGGFAILFLITFLALYFVHPAFKLTSTPLIIFLAFAIIVISGFVITILVQKFKDEITALQGMEGTVHNADLSRISAMLAAVQMGISTMRRRPLRTTLTAVTVILLTFTILCFASFSSTSGVIDKYLGHQHARPAQPHVLIHNVTWTPLTRGQVQFTQALLAGEANVFARVWLSSLPGATIELPITRADEGSAPAAGKARQTVTLTGVVGLAAGEQAIAPEVFQSLNGDMQLLMEGDGIALSRDTLDRLQAKQGQKISLQGRIFTVAGTFDETRLDEIRQLDGSPYLPLDYEAAKESAQGDQQMQGDALFRSIFQNMDPSSLSAVSPSQLAILSERNLLEIGGGPRAMVVVPNDPEAIGSLGRKLATLTTNPIYCGLPDGVHQYFYSSRMSFTGIGDLVVPLVLGGLIIFSTMLGSVVEREKEIFTFSALGLAPPHVAMLFFAEVCVYAVLGGLGGYLLAQCFVSVLTFLSTTFGIVRVPNVNYSSTTAIATILIVMVTVLLSTIYPALKASRSANPGVQRQWKIPRPVGDLHTIVFPFTVSAYDMKGIVSFLKEHLDYHNDISLGSFSAQQTAISLLGGNNMLGLSARVWLAPFDLGVSQEFKLSSRPSEIPGIHEITIEFHRLSGRPNNWERFNRVFINDLRKQFLIWRSLSHDAMESYRAKTEEAVNAAADAAKTDEGVKPVVATA